jgi:hypothetical protein
MKEEIKHKIFNETFEQAGMEKILFIIIIQRKGSLRL